MAIELDGSTAQDKGQRSEYEHKMEPFTPGTTEAEPAAVADGQAQVECILIGSADANIRARSCLLVP